MLSECGWGVFADLCCSAEYDEGEGSVGGVEEGWAEAAEDED